MSENNDAERRRHARSAVYKTCFVVVDSQEYTGAVVDISVGGAAVQFEVQLNIQPAPDTTMQLEIEGIGRLNTRVVRSRTSGVAVEFNIDPRRDHQLLEALNQALND